MQIDAPLPPDAAVVRSAIADLERLDAVRRTCLLDSPPDESFDRLTRLAAKLIGVPATFLSLVDQNRDFYKSSFGFDEPLKTTRQLEGTTFCHYALVSDGPLVLDDVTELPVFRDVPTVQSLGVRAYAGIPLVTEAGQVLGSFCAIDFKPRSWTASDIEVLSELAHSAMREIELRKAVQDLLTANQRLDGQVAALHASEDRYLAVMDALTSGVVLQCATGEIISSNTSAENLLGLSHAQLIGKKSIDPSWHCVHEDLTPWPGDTHPSMVALSSGKPVRDVVMGVYKPDGNITWITVNSKPMFEAGSERPHQVVTVFADISARKIAEDEVRVRERFMRTLTDSIPGLISYWNTDLICTFSNAGYQAHFGKSPAQMANIPALELLGEALFAESEPKIRAALRGELQMFERTLTKADGSASHTWVHYVPDCHPGCVNGFFVLVSDVTELKRAQLAAVESEQFARSIIDAVPEAICVLDTTGTVIAVNQPWRDYYDANYDDPQSIHYAIGTHYLQVRESATGANAAEAPLMAQGLAAVLGRQRDKFSLEYLCESSKAKNFIFAQVKRFEGDSGHVLVSHSNVTERKMLEMDLARMAQTDVLTGLNNRRHFIQLSETELSRTARYGGALSLLMLDIDHFKHINDTHGHQVGDTVIQALAAVCREQLRDLDVIGRLGGEEFAVTMPTTDHAQAMQVAERLRQAIEAASVPLPQGLPVRFTVSMGITTLPNKLTNLDTLLDQADQALYMAKKKGRNQVCSFVTAV